jgi:hypothetical protein
MVRKGRQRHGRRPSVDGRAYACYLEERAMLQELERHGLEAAWCAGYDAGQAGEQRNGEPSAHYRFGYRAGAADRDRGLAMCLGWPDREVCELEAER